MHEIVNAKQQMAALQDIISVIVCTYNQEDTIGRTLDSILAQKCHLPIEIVIGEDGSTDGTLAVCQQYQKLALCIPTGSSMMSRQDNTILLKSLASVKISSTGKKCFSTS